MRFHISIFLILLSIGLKAQSDFKVGISMGNVQPLNTFKLNSDLKDGHGFSESGFTLNFDGDYYVHNRFCLSAKLLFGNSTLNDMAMIEYLDTKLHDYLVVEEDKTLYDFSYWLWSSVLVGTKFNYPIIINKLYFELGIFSGFNINYLPDFNMQIIDEENKREIITENTNSNTQVSLPFYAEGAFRYKINDQTELKLGIGYFETPVKMTNASYIILDGENEIDETLPEIDFKGKIKTLNTTIGIVYQLK